MTPGGKKSEKLNFEEALERLENTVDRLESGELSLEESIKAFENGIELSKLCRKKLEKAEDRVKKLLEKSDGGFDLKLFEEDAEAKDE
ncbi:MAG: exodeoxyribonuclease VII small subunit [candidate division Zixibacteria bacterium]